MADELIDVYNKLKAKDSNLQSLHDMLVERDSNLTMGYGRLPDDEIGRYSAAMVGPRTLTVDRRKIGNDPDTLQQVLNHELTHAVDDELGTQSTWSKFYGNTPESAKFADAYDKLNPRKFLERYIELETEKAKKAPVSSSKWDMRRGNRINEAQAILDNRDKRGELYRGNPAELRAYGVGNSVVPKGAEWLGSSHLDSTMATEAAILNDLSNRARESELKYKNQPGVLDQFKNWATKYFQK
jgi:hypothetical protein